MGVLSVRGVSPMRSQPESGGYRSPDFPSYGAWGAAGYTTASSADLRISHSFPTFTAGIPQGMGSLKEPPGRL